MNARNAAARPLNIAMLSIHSSPVGPLGSRDTGGMSVYVRELAKWLGRDGHRIDIFTNVPGHDQLLFPNVRLIHLAGAGGRAIEKERLASHLPAVFAALEAFRHAEGRAYDLVHSHYWLSGVVGAMAQEQWNRPHVTMFHTLAMLKNRSCSGEAETGLRIDQERRLVQSVDHMVVPTRREQENLTRFYSAAPARVSIIPCGVNLEQFRPLDRHAARRQIGLDAETPLVLYVGRFAPLKGIDRLIEALALLQSRCAAPPRLVIVGGDGQHDPATLQLQTLAGSCGVGGRVHFAGRVEHEQLPFYYNAADVVALCSHYESFGLVVLEALACGTPVAATAVGVVDTVIREGVNGALMASPATPDIAAAIARVLAWPGADADDRRSAIRATVTAFGWQQVAAVMVALYHGLIEDHGAGQTRPGDAGRTAWQVRPEEGVFR